MLFQTLKVKNKPKYKTFRFFGFLFFLVFWAENLVAFQMQEKVPSIGEIAEKLIVGTDLITRVVLVACVSIGIILMISSLLSFKAHRQNPKFAPLDRPIFLMLFGLILISIPFLSSIFGPTGSVLELKELNKNTASTSKSQMVAPIDIDAPLEFGNEYDH